MDESKTPRPSGRQDKESASEEVSNAMQLQAEEEVKLQVHAQVRLLQILADAVVQDLSLK